MQKRSEKKVSYRQRLARFVAPIGGRAWRALIWQLVLVFLMLFAFAGQDAQAVSISLWGDFGTPPKTEFNIDESFEIQGQCIGADMETRRDMWWELRNSANEIVLDGTETTSDGLNGFGFIKKLGEYTNIEPGKSYRMTIECRTSDGPFRGNDYRKSMVNIRQLSGTYTAVVDTSDNLLVSGTVANGADSITVYLIDEDKKMHLFAEENNLTSDFDIRKRLPPGKHELRVYADYRKFSKRLGTSFVATRPVVTLDALPAYTNDPKVELSGRASAPDGIKRRVFEGRNRKGQKMSMGLNYYEEYPSVVQEIGDLKHTFDFSGDGLFSFQYTVTSDIGAKVTSDPPQTIHVDTRAPDVNDVSPSAASYLKRDQTFTANVIDLDKTGEAGSGLKSVQLGYKNKTGTFSWLPMQSGTGDNYSVDIPFDALQVGENRFKVWTQDNAENVFETAEMIYQKAPPPKVTMDTPLTPTKIAKFNITGHAKSDAGLQRAEITWWKEDEPNNKRSIALNAAGTEEDIDHEIELPEDGKYLVQLSARSLDGQSFLAKPQEVLLHTSKPRIINVRPQSGTVLKNDFTLAFHVDADGVGIAKVEIQVGKDKPWIKNIQGDKKGNYSHKLPLDAFDAGTTTVSIWAKDELDHEGFSHQDYTKEVQAADALDATLSILATDGGVPQEAFYADQERLLRLSVKPAIAIDDLEIAYKLPAGLKPLGPARLGNGAGMTPELQKAISEQLSNWRDDGALLKGINLPDKQTLEVDIPVKIDLSTPSLKSGGVDAPTSFEVSGSNITDTTRAETNWRADWKKAPADVNNPLATDFDLSTASTISIFDNVSGGYDTATPEKWNRNTLRCAASNVQCQDHADNNDTSIKLLFTEAASKQTVTLVLKGQRQLSLISGAMRNTPLGSPDNAGADAEARFSVSLPKEELEKLPTEGHWSATLDMQLQDFGGAKKASFRSEITLNVSDATGMAMTPPQIQLLPGSHQDLDNSGGFSAGDELTYRISYNGARNLSDVQLDYDLPPGLERSDVAATFAAGSDIKQQEKLRKDGSKALLKNGLAMKKGESLVIDLPLRIKQSNEMQIVSQVSASADGYGAMTSAKEILQVQQRFAAEQALTLTFDMVAPDADKVDRVDKAAQPIQAGATVAHKAPFVYRITLTAQKQTVKNASLRYRLPGGLSRTDAPIVIKGPATALLNAQWNGDADDELLAANSDLSPGESLTLDIPILVKEAVGNGVSVKSTVNAGAGNLSDGLRATHTVKVRERLSGNDRVMVVKTSDANAEVQPGARIAYQIRVSNQTSKTVRNLLIRDRAADHSEMVASSCGELPAETCSTFTLNDSDIVEGQMTHDALCKTPDRKSVPGGRHVFWCLNGDLDPLADYVVDYTLQVNGSAPPP